MQLGFLHLLFALTNFFLSLFIAKMLGPAEFGKYAYIAALALFFHRAVYDWLRLSATRFYSEKVRENEPKIRASLNLAFLVSMIVLGSAFVIFIILNIDIGFTKNLIFLAILIGTAIGLYDTTLALLRAIFNNRLSRIAILSRCFLSFFITIPVTYFSRDTELALISIFLAILIPVILVYPKLKDKNVTFHKASLSEINMFAHYGFPIIITSLIYDGSLFIYRNFILDNFGSTALGQFMLAQNIGIQVLITLGSAIDIILFQSVIFKQEHFGLEDAKSQLRYNFSILVLILLPVGLGLWLVLPSFVAIFIPSAFQHTTLDYLSILLPAMTLRTFIGFMAFQNYRILKKTYPLVIAASIGMVFNIILVLFFSDKTNHFSTIYMQFTSYIFDTIVLLSLILFKKGCLPKFRTFTEIFLSAFIMTCLVYPLRNWQANYFTLFCQIAIGCLSYSFMIAVLDTAELRSTYLTPLFKRFILKQHETSRLL